jgi:hypothetical protein
MMSQCLVIRRCNSIILHGEEKSTSKKNTVWGESSEFFVSGEFNYCERVGRNSLTLARMIMYMHHIPDITFVEVICIIRAFELRSFQMVQ